MQYSKRIWLNPESSSSTGSFVAFHGKTLWGDNQIEDETFIELADCRSKIRLHKKFEDSIDDFINKLKLLNYEIDNFIKFLENGE